MDVLIDPEMDVLEQGALIDRVSTRPVKRPRGPRKALNFLQPKFLALGIRLSGDVIPKCRSKSPDA